MTSNHASQSPRTSLLPGWALIALWLLAFVLGAIGFRLNEAGLGHALPWLSAGYQSLQLFVLHLSPVDRVHPVLELARWLAPLVTFAALLEGLLRLFQEKIEMLRLRWTSRHVVLCGLGSKAIEIVKRQRQQYHTKMVVIEQDGHTPQLAACRAVGATVILGDMKDPAVLELARVPFAAELIALCGDDGTNIEAVLRAKTLASEKNPQRIAPLKCWVQIGNPYLRDAFQRTQVLKENAGPCAIHFFDVYEFEARRWFEKWPLDRQGLAANDPRQVHLVILGLGKMGSSMTLKAAQLGHWANGRKLRISIVDRDAEVQRQQFLFRYPAFEDLCDVSYQQSRVESETTLRHLITWCQEPGTLSSFAFCCDNDEINVELAMRLLPYARLAGAAITIRLKTANGLALLLSPAGAGPRITDNVHTFGMLDDACWQKLCTDDTRDKLARAIHAEFVQQRLVEGRSPDERALQPWDALDDSFKDSNRQQADHIPVKLRALGLEAAELSDSRPEAADVLKSQENLDLLARMEHARWVAERRLAGWTFAPGPKNEENRTSPYLIPWDQLEEKIKNYDRETVVKIPLWLAKAGQKIVRQING